jgi:hypothetical protein
MQHMKKKTSKVAKAPKVAGGSRSVTQAREGVGAAKRRLKQAKLQLKRARAAVKTAKRLRKRAEKAARDAKTSLSTRPKRPRKVASRRASAATKKSGGRRAVMKPVRTGVAVARTAQRKVARGKKPAKKALPRRRPRAPVAAVAPLQPIEAGSPNETDSAVPPMPTGKIDS